MKSQLINIIIRHLHSELDQLLEAANNAHLAAIDDQSVAETQYDTLAIEAGYLAEGQSRRVQALKKSIVDMTSLASQLTTSPQKLPVIGLGALVQLSDEKTTQHFYFIAPAAPGFTCNINEADITVITPQSPLGQALVNLEVGDEVTLPNSHSNISKDVILIQ